MSLDIADRMVVMGMRANSMAARAGKESHENTPPCSPGLAKEYIRIKQKSLFEPTLPQSLGGWPGKKWFLWQTSAPPLRHLPQGGLTPRAF